MTVSIVFLLDDLVNSSRRRGPSMRPVHEALLNRCSSRHVSFSFSKQPPYSSEDTIFLGVVRMVFAWDF